MTDLPKQYAKITRADGAVSYAFFEGMTQDQINDMLSASGSSAFYLSPEDYQTAVDAAMNRPA